jgi:GNAT superfamily N-acetyltransferase
MDITIRRAVADDREYIASWTADTFSWGDYVGAAFGDWLEEEHGVVIVAEVDGLPKALGRIRMVSESEAWSNAMRVHPDLRRTGIGTAVGEAMWQWADKAGARVIRLAVEDWNMAARGQVTKAGFRPMGDWFWAQRGVGDSSPVPEGNGGQRVKGYEAIKPANPAEAEPALLSWSGGELARAAHGLFAIGWTWQRLTVSHLAEASKQRMLWDGRPGWAYAAPVADRFEVYWMETNPEDSRAMVRALVERAADSGSDTMRAVVPHVDWLIQAFRRAGFDIGGIIVFGLAL